MSIKYTNTSVQTKQDQIVKSNWQTTTNYNPKPVDSTAFQRVLLKANGTVTAMLEAYLDEPIKIVKLSEQVTKIELDVPNLKFDQEEEVIARKVLLQGQISQCNFIYADSYILIDNLEERFSNSLLNTKIPIGKLWSEQRVETFKEIIDSGMEPANELADYFDIDPQANILFRTYAVYTQGKITMIITEKFPEVDFVPQVSLAS